MLPGGRIARCVKCVSWLTAHENSTAWSRDHCSSLKCTWQSCVKPMVNSTLKAEFFMCGCVVRQIPRCALCVCECVYNITRGRWRKNKVCVRVCKEKRREKLKQSIKDETGSAWWVEGPALASWGEAAHILYTHQPQSAHKSGVYLLEAAHEVVANWRSGQVSCARTPSNIEKVVRA